MRVRHSTTAQTPTSYATAPPPPVSPLSSAYATINSWTNPSPTALHIPVASSISLQSQSNPSHPIYASVSPLTVVDHSNTHDSLPIPLPLRLPPAPSNFQTEPLSTISSLSPTCQSTICPFDEKVHYTPHVQLDKTSAAELAQSDIFFSKEFAELSMVCRVLSMALDNAVPLLDRFKFLCIVSSFLDEHFAKRLGSIPKLDLTDLQTATINLRRHVRPKTTYEEDLAQALRTIMDKQSHCLTSELLPQLAQKGIHVIPYRKLSDSEKQKMVTYFKQHLRPALTPTVIDPTHPFPLIQSHEIYIYVRLFNPKNGLRRTLVFRCPSPQRLVPIDDSGLRFVTSEDICLTNLNLVCTSMIVICAYPFRVTRNTKISIDDESLSDMTDQLDFIIEEVHRRRRAPATRLEVLNGAPQQMIDLLVNKLYLDELDVYVLDTPYLDLSSCMSLAFVSLPWLRQVLRDPVVPSLFKGLQNRLIADPGAIFDVIGKQDVLVEYPRDNFENSAVLFLHASARDPRVRSIKSVLYRGGGDSPIVASLIRAAKNGKEVSVIIELKASFDEIQNSEYARALQVAGCNVTYGVMGLKVHSKIMQVVREESNGSLCSYCNISTGNFNPGTAKLYTDYSLFTCDKEICTDVLDVFNHLTGYSENTEYRCLLVAPSNMLDRFIELIRREAQNARDGKPARIACQMNGLSDKTITKELYVASQAGVRIDLIVRGACRVRPGIKGISDNINVYSWVGQILQHRRVYYFHAGGEGEYFIGSADWRTRNLTGRVEVITPIKDSYLRKRLSKAFELIDDEKWVWRMASDGHYYKGFLTTSSPPVSVSIAPNCQMFSKSERKKLENRSSDSDGDERNQDGFEMAAPASERGYADREAAEEAIAHEASIGAVSGNELIEDVQTSKRTKSRPRHVVNIKGNTKMVDKVAVGVVPIRFVNGEENIESVQVLMVAREADDPWAVPKGGRNEGETQIEATIRIAREKAGVSSYEVMANLGWIEVHNGQKHAAFQTVVLLAKELGTTVGRSRRRMWMPIEQALEYSKGENSHEFTAKALDRGLAAVKSWSDGYRDGSSELGGAYGGSSIYSASSAPSLPLANRNGSVPVDEGKDADAYRLALRDM